MLPDELAGYKTLYLQTAWDYVRNLEGNLFLLKSDPKNHTAIDSMHVSAHSLKSQSLVMKFTSLGLVCKEIELYFRNVKEGKRAVSPDDLGILGEVVEELKDSLSSISAEDQEKDLTEVEKKMQDLVNEGAQ
jgi:chemotaxis protein histidine kinase CheA